MRRKGTSKLGTVQFSGDGSVLDTPESGGFVKPVKDPVWVLWDGGGSFSEPELVPASDLELVT